ncbi:hypothetical protein, partial [Enterobacter kobei]|uniref:hypothetical protein n=1 Tax=Enterobacter kobei TaxID=208224 RepID=UPI0019530123
VLSDQREAVGIDDLCHDSCSCLTGRNLSLRLPPLGSCAAKFTIGNHCRSFRKKIKKQYPAVL